MKNYVELFFGEEWLHHARQEWASGDLRRRITTFTYFFAYSFCIISGTCALIHHIAQ